MGKGGDQRTRDRMEEAETVGPAEGEVHEKPKKLVLQNPRKPGISGNHWRLEEENEVKFNLIEIRH